MARSKYKNGVTQRRGEKEAGDDGGDDVSNNGGSSGVWRRISMKAVIVA